MSYLKEAIKRATFRDPLMISKLLCLFIRVGGDLPASAGLSGSAGSPGYANRYPCEKTQMNPGIFPESIRHGNDGKDERANLLTKIPLI